MFVDSQLEILRWLAGIRNPVTDAIFVFLNFFDTIYFYIAFLPLIWFFAGKRIGLRFLFVLLLSGAVNQGIKDFFALPRPFFYDPTVALITVKGYTFPSGAAQGSALLAWMLWDHSKRKKTASWLILYALVIGLSRVFLGVHFPVDVVAGWMVGSLLFFIYKFIYMPYEKKIQGYSKRLLVVPVGTTLVCWLIWPSLSATVALFSLIGVSISWLLTDFLQFPALKRSFSWMRVLSWCGIVLSLFSLLFMLKWAVPPDAFYKIPLLFLALGFMLEYEIGLINYLSCKR